MDAPAATRTVATARGHYRSTAYVYMYKHCTQWLECFKYNKYVGPPYCQAEMYAGRVACCPLVSQSEYADGANMIHINFLVRRKSVTSDWSEHVGLWCSRCSGNWLTSILLHSFSCHSPQSPISEAMVLTFWDLTPIVQPTTTPFSLVLSRTGMPSQRIRCISIRLKISRQDVSEIM